MKSALSLKQYLQSEQEHHVNIRCLLLKIIFDHRDILVCKKKIGLGLRKCGTRLEPVPVVFQYKGNSCKAALTISFCSSGGMASCMTACVAGTLISTD